MYAFWVKYAFRIWWCIQGHAMYGLELSRWDWLRASGAKSGVLGEMVSWWCQMGLLKYVANVSKVWLVWKTQVAKLHVGLHVHGWSCLVCCAFGMWMLDLEGVMLRLLVKHVFEQQSWKLCIMELLSSMWCKTYLLWRLWDLPYMKAAPCGDSRSLWAAHPITKLFEAMNCCLLVVQKRHNWANSESKLENFTSYSSEDLVHLRYIIVQGNSKFTSSLPANTSCSSVALGYQFISRINRSRKHRS